MLAATLVAAQKLVLTNDDGWATAQIRKQYESLKTAEFDVRIGPFHDCAIRSS